MRYRRGVPSLKEHSRMGGPHRHPIWNKQHPSGSKGCTGTQQVPVARSKEVYHLHPCTQSSHTTCFALACVLIFEQEV